MPQTHDFKRLFTHSVYLDPKAPRFHRALTAEYDDPCRYSHSLVIRTPFSRAGRWHGIRKSWLSAQVKLPTGEPIGARWGIVIGWWRYPGYMQEWEALVKATRLGHETDGDDDRNFNDPSCQGIDSTTIDLFRRRVDVPGDAGAGE